MALRYAVASGNWSNPATWDGGLTIPGSGDTVRPNTYTIYIDQDITITELTNNTSSPSTQGGKFILLNGVTVTGNLSSRYNYTNGPSTHLSMVEISQSNSATIIGNITNALNGNYTYPCRMDDSSNLIITGSLISTGGSAYQTPLLHFSTGTVRILGNIVGGLSTNRNYGIRINNGGNVYIIGDITGSQNANGPGIGIDSGNGSYINVVGNCLGRQGPAIATTSTSATNTVIVITGSVSGNSTSVAYGGITLYGLANFLYISGSVSAGTSVGPGIYTGQANLIYVNGPISSSTTSNGIQGLNAGVTILTTGPFYNTGSFNAVYAYRMQMIEPTSTTWRFDTEVAGISKTLYTANQLPGVPRQSDVRKGTQYNFGLTGSLEMPDPTTVKQGVAIDNTTGSAILTAQDMFDVLTQDITQTGSIGSTLKNAATVQTTAATISAFKV
jgi:hypothetical protein